jgi:hypothetical protein
VVKRNFSYTPDLLFCVHKWHKTYLNCYDSKPLLLIPYLKLHSS